MLNFYLYKNCKKKVLILLIGPLTLVIGTEMSICFFLSRMESTEKCEAIIQHFNGKFIKIPPGVPGACQTLCCFQFFLSKDPDIAPAVAETSVFLCWLLLSLSLPLPRMTPPVPTEPLLCKFADGGQKKRQNQGKYLQNGRPWARDPDTVSESFFRTPNMNFLPRILAGDQNRKHVSKAAQFFPPLLLVGWLFFLFVWLSDKPPSAFAWPHEFWILFIVFPGRNDACVWPHSLTKWVSGMQRPAENNPTAEGEICSRSTQTEVICCPLLVVPQTETSPCCIRFSDLCKSKKKRGIFSNW